MTERPGPPAFVRSLEHLVDFVDTAAMGLHWVGADGTILWANPADYEPLGYSAGDYIGHNIAEFHADPHVIADILRRLAAGERLNNHEARLRCKDGSVRHVEITSSVLFEAGPAGRKFVHTRCYTHDVTERKRLEEARNRFVSILGHDLRNPLSSIALAADQLLRAPDLAEKHTTPLERIARSAARMSRMIVDLIEFARTLGDRMPVRRSPMDFGEVCQRIVDEVRQASPGARIDLELSGDLRGSWDPIGSRRRSPTCSSTPSSTASRRCSCAPGTPGGPSSSR
jgi:PAS domain S-box-containing protein